MSFPPFPPPVPAGWYHDPGGHGLRYWDGTAWTQHLAPLPPSGPPVPRRARKGDWIGGILLALFIPIAGIVAGVVYLTLGDERRQVGLVTLVLACVMSFFWVAVSFATAAPSYG